MLHGPSCSSTTFSVHGIEYRQVCGKIISYQYASTDAFGVQIVNDNERFYDVDEIMSMALVSLMGEIQDGISGHLLQLLMKWEHIHVTTVLVPTLTVVNLHHDHLALLGMTTSVTLAVQIIGYIYFTQTTPYGMELVVDQPTPAAL